MPLVATLREQLDVYAGHTGADEHYAIFHPKRALIRAEEEVYTHWPEEETYGGAIYEACQALHALRYLDYLDVNERPRLIAIAQGWKCKPLEHTYDFVTPYDLAHFRDAKLKKGP